MSKQCHTQGLKTSLPFLFPSCPFFTVPKNAEFAVLQAEYTLDFLMWCIDPFYFLLEDMGKRTNSLHHPFTYIFHKRGGILDCLIKIRISPELSYALIFIMTRVIECDLQQDNYFAVPKALNHPNFSSIALVKESKP